MQLKWLEDLLCLAQTGSVTRAADHRHVTHPAFGRRIKALESWVGVPLVDRTAFPTRLTPEGKIFLEGAREAIASLEEARTAARQMYGEDASLLELATGKTLSRTVIPDWLLKLQKNTGPFQVRLHTIVMHDGADLLAQRSVDLLVCYFHPAVQFYLDEQLYEHCLVKQERLVPVSLPDKHGAPRYSLSGKGPIPYLSYAQGLTQGRILSHFLVNAPFSARLTPVHELDFAEAIQELAVRGVGLAWLPESLIAADLQTRRLVKVGTPEVEIPFEVRVYRARDNHKPLIETIWQELKNME